MGEMKDTDSFSCVTEEGHRGQELCSSLVCNANARSSTCDEGFDATAQSKEGCCICGLPHCERYSQAQELDFKQQTEQSCTIMRKKAELRESNIGQQMKVLLCILF